MENGENCIMMGWTNSMDVVHEMEYIIIKEIFSVGFGGGSKVSKLFVGKLIVDAVNWI